MFIHPLDPILEGIIKSKGMDIRTSDTKGNDVTVTIYTRKFDFIARSLCSSIVQAVQTESLENLTWLQLLEASLHIANQNWVIFTEIHKEKDSKQNEKPM